MAAYLVLTPPDGDAEGDRTLFLRDGFSFLAFILPVFWFLWHRLWLWSLGFLVLMMLTGMLVGRDSTYWTGFSFAFAASLFAGLEGRQRLAEKRMREGWELAAVVEADDAVTAETIYYSVHGIAEREEDVASQGQRRPAPSGAAGRPATPRTLVISNDARDSFGLFEWNRRR